MAEITAIPHHDDIASSSTASCSASVSDPRVKCDIYINHCEQDAGNFATDLCSLLESLGLQVFLHKVEFNSEDEVKSRMETAISQAAVRIAIFSPNYASWKWSMDSLVHMTKSGGTIIPVFYKVEPSEVRRMGGVYAAWKLDHEEKQRYNSETTQNWKDAMFQVSHISGLELQKCDGDEQDLSRKVVQSVFKDSPGLRYNVFLSHRGPETKEIFASPLYDRLLSHGIRAFLGTRELVEGHRTAPQLELAIQFASVNIVIFSPRFAESPWCFEELFLMTKFTAAILPVFYEVNPSDLNGRYVEALFHHLKKQRFDADTIERWRYALADVPDLNDFVLDGNKEELIVKIVQSVSEILSKPSEVGQSYEVVQRTAECVLQENVPKRPEVVQRVPVEENYVGLLEKIQDFEKVVLQRLDVSKCSNILELPGVEHLTSLEELNAMGCSELQSIPELGQLTKLRKIDVSWCKKIPKLSGVEKLTSLEELNAKECWGLQSIPELGQLTKLRKIDVSLCPMIQEIPIVSINSDSDAGASGLASNVKTCSHVVAKQSEIHSLFGSKSVLLRRLDFSNSLLL